MTFAIAISVVLIVSTAMLLYQYWTAALDTEDARDAATGFPERPTRPARIDASPRNDGDYRANTAA